MTVFFKLKRADHSSPIVYFRINLKVCSSKSNFKKYTFLNYAT